MDYPKALKSIRVNFIQVSSNQMKLSKIAQTASSYFEKKEPIIFKVPHQNAIEYIDLLLWRYPKDSFLPHRLSDSPCDDLIVITSSSENLNQARSIFNLTKDPIDNESDFFTHIYEFEDKKDLSHYQIYKDRGYAITLTSGSYLGTST